jgi:glycosyltransferase involved in cell wall biosynthesis
MSGRPLRIALVAPLVSPIAEPFMGGSQALLHDLATALAVAGHAVTLFAADDSVVPGAEVVRLGIDSQRLRPTDFAHPGPTDPALLAEERLCFLRIAYEIRRRAGEFDVVHNHAFDAPPFELLQDAHGHVCHTLHLPPVVPAVTQAIRQAAAQGAILVTVSCWAGAAWTSEVGQTRRILNGVPVDRIALGPRQRSGWLFVGRIAPEKGLEAALQAADAAERRLRIVGPVYDRDYAARLRSRLERHDLLGGRRRDQVFVEMGAAEGLLMPANWDEPFGLTAAEAMAAGTPVAAYARGALAEVIADGETGYLVTPGDVSGLQAAAARFTEIDPRACRRRAVERFSLARMVSEYETLYRELA